MREALRRTTAGEGISGAKGRDKRPALDKLLEAVSRREFDLVARGPLIGLVRISGGAGSSFRF
jgi:hypothetical protein